MKTKITIRVNGEFIDFVEDTYYTDDYYHHRLERETVLKIDSDDGCVLIPTRNIDYIILKEIGE